MKIKKMGNFLLFLLKENVIGITLAPFGIFLRSKYLNHQNMIIHESIHWKQQIEMLIIPFYIWYLIEWVYKTIIYGKKGYRNISFEREAYKNENNYNYLKTRKWFSSMKYITLKNDSDM